MRYLRILDIGKVISGATPKTNVAENWDGDIPWVTPKEISLLDTPYLTGTERKLTEIGYRSCSTKLLPPNCILLTSRAPIGLLAINTIEVCTNQGFKSIKLNENAFPLFVYYCLKHHERQLKKLGVGTTFKEISKAKLEQFKIPIPGYEDQIKIATLLQKVETLIAKRKDSIALLDGLVKSTFLEMFGGEESSRYQLYELRKLAAERKGSMRTGPFGSSLLHSEFKAEGEVKVLGIDNVVNNIFEEGKPRYISMDRFQDLKRYQVFPKDLLISIMGTNGRCAVVPENIPVAINTKHLAAISINPKMATPEFISKAILFDPNILSQLRRQTKGAVMGGLNLSIIKKLKINLPPLNLQNQFASSVEKIETLKIQTEQSLTELQNLYGALSQKAFKGELDLSHWELREELIKRIGYESEVELFETSTGKGAVFPSHGTNLYFGDPNEELIDGLDLVQDQFLKVQEKAPDHEGLRSFSDQLKAIRESIKSFTEPLEQSALFAKVFTEFSESIGNMFSLQKELNAPNSLFAVLQSINLTLPKVESPISKEVFEIIEQFNSINTLGSTLKVDVERIFKGVYDDIFDGNYATIAQVGKWVKSHYTGYHFTPEMLLHSLRQSDAEFSIQYLTTKEREENQKADLSRDLKEMVFMALSEENPFLELEQFFHEDSFDTAALRFRPEDKKWLASQSGSSNSGIYLKIKEAEA